MSVVRSETRDKRTGQKKNNERMGVRKKKVKEGKAGILNSRTQTVQDQRNRNLISFRTGRSSVRVDRVERRVGRASRRICIPSKI